MGHNAVKKYPLDKERAMDLWEKGFCDKEIARELGSTVGAGGATDQAVPGGA